MICPDCQTEIQIRPGADVQICGNCRRSKRRRRHVPKLEPKTEAGVKYRIDAQHSANMADVGKDQTRHLSLVSTWLGTGSQIHVVFFGLLVFLLGQVLHVWAFLVGNYLAWTIANFMTVVGITAAIFAVVKSLKNLENRISVLAKIKSSNHRPARSKQPRGKTPIENRL